MGCAAVSSPYLLGLIFTQLISLQPQGAQVSCYIKNTVT